MKGKVTTGFYGQRLKQLRERLGLSQRDLANVIGSFKANNICYWENGGNPRQPYVEQLARFFEVPESYFLSEKEPPFPEHIDLLDTKLPKYLRKKVAKQKQGETLEEEKPEKLPLDPVTERKLEAVSKVLGISIEDVMEIEEHTRGAQKAIAYVKQLNTQLDNIREFQNVLDSYLGRLNDRLLELSDLQTKAKQLSDAIKGEDRSMDFNLLAITVANR